MRASYNVTGSERKDLVGIIGDTVGMKPVYKFMPTCAYVISNITVEKDGTVVWDGRTDEETIRRVKEALAAAGFTAQEEIGEPTEEEHGEPEAEEDADAVSLTVKVPMSGHTGMTLRNLINLIYTRAGLINRALGTSFTVDEGLKDALQDDACTLSAEKLLQTITDYEGENGPSLGGITLTPEDITFASLPETEDMEKIRAFTVLCGMMNRMALTQKRIQAKAVNDENEKYALRIWLTRLGMNGDEYKEARKVLMENLTGHSAFRTNADKERWMERQAEKKAELKAAKEAHGEGEAE